MAVIYTPHFYQFFDDNGDPLSGGQLFTFAAGTVDLPKATYTTADASVQNSNPIILDSSGRATLFLVGAYKFVLKDANGVDVPGGETDNINAFTTAEGEGQAFFQAFSGTGAQTIFTLSEDLGDDEKIIMVFVDFDIQNPANYTLDGTSLTFNVAPPSGTGNIQVWAPSKLAAAAAASAAAADLSATQAAASAAAALGGVGFTYLFANLTADADPGNGNFRFNNAALPSVTELYISETTQPGQMIDGVLATWDGSSSTNKGTLKFAKQGDPTNFCAYFITGTGVDAGNYYRFTLSFIESQGAFLDTDSITVEFLPSGDKGDTGDQGPSGNIDNIATQPEAVIASDDIVIFADVSDSNNSKRDTAQGVLDLIASSPNVVSTSSIQDDAVTTPKIADSVFYAHKNKIINGDFTIAQRGTSFVNLLDDSYTLDRWLWIISGASADGVVTISQNSDAPTVAQASRLITNSALIDVTTADAALAAEDFYIIVQRIEGYNFRALAQKSFTLSFWVKATKTGVYSAGFRNAGQDRSYVAEYTINAADTWEFKTITVAASPSAGTWDYTNGIGLRINFSLGVGSTFSTSTIGSWQVGDFFSSTNQVNAMDNTANNFRLAGVQIEAGENATPFEERLYGAELALAQRYFLTGVYREAGGQAFSYSLPTTMRATPTYTTSGGVFAFTLSDSFGFAAGVEADRTVTASAEL